jgi:antitoxin (DNA-binding transcriptional repressor) of toxin-antitoxin stability system
MCQNNLMNVSTAEAKTRLTELIRAVEAGDEVIITRHGKPVVQLNLVPQTGKVVFGGMKDRIKLYPGWDEPINIDRFLAGDL